MKHYRAFRRKAVHKNELQVKFVKPRFNFRFAKQSTDDMFSDYFERR